MPRGGLDRVDPDGTVEGWCWAEAAAPTAPRTVAVTLDGHVAARARCSRPRDDLAVFGVPPGAHGFLVRLPAARRQPGAEAEVAARDVASGQLLGAPRRVRWRQADAPADPPADAPAAVSAAPAVLMGNLDRVTRDGWVAGWCWDPGRPRHRVTVEILVDETVVGTTPAANWRADLQPAGVGDGAHGFTFALPYALLAATGTLRVRVREAGGGRPVGAAATVRVGLRADDDERMLALEREVTRLRARLDELTREAAARPAADERAARALFETVAGFFQELAEGRADEARAYGPGTGLRATIDALRAALPPLTLRRPPVPADVLVIVPATAPVAAVHRCLAALHAAGVERAAELRVLDPGRADPACAFLPALIPGLAYRHCEAAGLVRAARDAVAETVCPLVAFVDPWVDVGAAWLGESVGTARREGAAAVTALLVGRDGLTRHGGYATAPGGMLADPTLLAEAAEAPWRAMRRVEACGAFAVVLDRHAMLRAGTLDPKYDSLHHAVAAVSLRMRTLGGALLCQPAARARWAGDAGADPSPAVPDLGAPTEDARRLRLAVLEAGPPPVVGHALFVDDAVPRPDRDAGSVAAMEQMRTLVALGWRVTFAAADGRTASPTVRADLERLGIDLAEPPAHPSALDAVRALGPRLGLVWLTRHGNAERLAPAVRGLAPEARLVFAPADLHALREGRAAQLAVRRGRRGRAMPPVDAALWARELACARAADATVLLSGYERDLLAGEVDPARLHVLPWIARAAPPGPDFALRDGVLFVGGFGHRPNLDAVTWYAAAVLPLLRATRPALVTHLVGADPPAEVVALAAADVMVHGWVADLDALLDRVRLTVAPLRFGAGFKGKVATSLARGVPVIATGIALEGTGLDDGDGVVLADDAAAIAATIARAHDDAEAWRRLSERARERVAALYAPERARTVLRTILEALGLPVGG